MSFIIAVSGKGGVGKTTLAGLLITRLIANQKRPVLAVDADPNTCLDEVLGVSIKSTIGGAREEARELVGKGLSAGVSKQELLEMKIEQSIVEAQDFDLIAMGRPEGPGCYCYANNVLKNALAKLSDQYPYVVLDNEAGLENLSRRIVRKVNLLVMVTDPSKRGLETVKRLHQLAKEMGVQYDRLVIVINRMRVNALSPAAESLQKETGADLVLGLPEDEELAEFAEQGRSLTDISENNAVVKKINGLIKDELAQP
ncbi:AAA family ATPase [bacterium]|nr:AAA family ATPase [bacterium]